MTNASRLVRPNSRPPTHWGAYTVTVEYLTIKKRPGPLSPIRSRRTGLNLLVTRQEVEKRVQTTNDRWRSQSLSKPLGSVGQALRRSAVTYRAVEWSWTGPQSPTHVKFGGRIRRQDGRSDRSKGRDASGSHEPGAEGVLSLDRGGGEVRRHSRYDESKGDRLATATPRTPYLNSTPALTPLLVVAARNGRVTLPPFGQVPARPSEAS